ncbi:unnamed protein product [Phyllotreta striolata]|uniref:C2H2-type domain-containing protein n=1 Tax=Phyllotreta striolata TaxID=444603 RepID=A0A9N9XUB6_PHYSR|nr:unnamed protein product [Phyllotreta striolata]
MNWHYCSNCSRKYSSKVSLKQHLRLECGKEPTFCCTSPGCQYKAKRLWNLKRHYMHSHNLTTRWHYCCNCSRKYSSQVGLRQHLRLECGKEATFCCQYPGCGYKAKRLWTLKQHLSSRKHSQTKTAQQILIISRPESE